MTPKPKATKHKAGYVHSRLTSDEQARVEEQARACGVTVSRWVRQTLLEALDKPPSERRLITFIAAQTLAIRIAMEEAQQGKDLSKPDVRERIERLAVEASRVFAAQGRKPGEAS